MAFLTNKRNFFVPLSKWRAVDWPRS